jgi:hypothetical protein
MSRTRFCDSAGFTVLVRAHKRAVAEGGELRLVIPLFSSLDEALAPRPAAVIQPLRPRKLTGVWPGKEGEKA